MGFPQFRTEIDGVDIHFLHVRSPHQDALPLLMTHGWPGSVVEFGKVIGPLTDPVAYGGDEPTPSTWCARRCPDMASAANLTGPAGAFSILPMPWAELMARLGYQRYGAAGRGLGRDGHHRARPSGIPSRWPGST